MVNDLGLNIRQFFRSLFGSRVSEILETSILQLRQDTEQRIQEKNEVIASLREEKAQLVAELTLYRLRAGLPTASQLSAKKQPSFLFDTPQKTSWQLAQEAHDAENARLDAEEALALAQKKEASQ
jgi:hypothetical protein